METPNTPEPAHDTASIAANALATLESAQTPTTETPAAESPSAGSVNETPAAAAPAATATTAEELSESAKFLISNGHKHGKRPDGKTDLSFLPFTTVEKMLSRYLDHHRGSFDKERETWAGENKHLGEQAEMARRFRALVQGDPRAALTELARIDPRYQSFLVPPKPALPAEEDDPEPLPDIDMGNGRSTYSLNGIRKLREWDRRRMERAMDERMKPIAEMRERAARAEAQAQFEQHIQARSQAQIERAKTWPKFAEYEPQILKVLQDDSAQAEKNGTAPQLSLHDAWMQVVLPVLTGNHNQVRESVMKELNGAPKSTGVGQTGPEPTRAPAQRSTEEIARRAMARLEGRG